MKTFSNRLLAIIMLLLFIFIDLYAQGQENQQIKKKLVVRSMSFEVNRVPEVERDLFSARRPREKFIDFVTKSHNNALPSSSEELSEINSKIDKEALDKSKPPNLTLPADRFIQLSKIGSEKKQTSEDSVKKSKSSSNKNEFSIWGGYSPDTTTAINFGSGQDSRLGVFGLRFARRFNNSSYFNLKYTIDVVPVAVFNFPHFNNSNRRRAVRRTEYAFGVAPLGIQANFRPNKKIQPFVSNSWGILIVRDSVPNINGKRLNFTIDAGGGVEIILNDKKDRALTIGYKLQHISNAYRGEFNPGYDNNLFYVGYRFFSN